MRKDIFQRLISALLLVALLASFAVPVTFAGDENAENGEVVQCYNIYLCDPANTDKTTGPADLGHPRNYTGQCRYRLCCGLVCSFPAQQGFQGQEKGRKGSN